MSHSKKNVLGYFEIMIGHSSNWTDICNVFASALGYLELWWSCTLCSLELELDIVANIFSHLWDFFA